MKAVGLRRSAQRYRDYTAERLVAEGKLPPDSPTLHLVTESTPAAPPPPAASLYDRLVQRFGLGDQPVKRQALYRRIERLCNARGKEVEVWIYEAADKATSAEQPDRYFCACVVRMLRGLEVHTL